MTDEEQAPPWAEVLLDSLFTGSSLDFKGIVLPSWLQERLEAEYGMPVPTGEPVPSGPVDLDDERPTLIGDGWMESVE